MRHQRQFLCVVHIANDILHDLSLRGISTNTSASYASEQKNNRNFKKAVRGGAHTWSHKIAEELS